MTPVEKLKKWFFDHARTLPWRKTRDPYAIWVSEVMLQQTQVSVVIPYYSRWLKAFPNLKALANAQEEQVIKLWEGLGYYSRARSLHKGAKLLCENYGGELPSWEGELLKIPGIGPYTAAAIVSFAFHKRALALDGNVIRVLSRYLGHAGLISKESVKTELKSLGEHLLCDQEPWICAEALIEIGALVCKKASPNCSACPLADTCVANRKNLQSTLPNTPSRRPAIKLYRAVAIGFSGGSLLLKKPAKKGVMKGLYEFPFVELRSKTEANPLEAEKFFDSIGLRADFVEELSSQKHGFTHHSATLFPFVYSVEKKRVDGYIWCAVDDLHTLPFSSGHRKIIIDLQSFLGTYVK